MASEESLSSPLRGSPPRVGPPRSLKVVLIGDAGGGKTSLRNKYLTGRFSASYKATIGADFMAKKLPLNPLEPKGQQVTVSIWDTAGQERFHALGSAFYRGADAVILVVDTSKRDAMDNASRWIKEFQERAPVQPGTETRRFCWLCVGAKADLRDGKDDIAISEIVGKLSELLGLPASEAKPEPGAPGLEGPGAGDEEPAKPQEVLARKLPDQKESKSSGQASSDATPTASSSFWGSFRRRKSSVKEAPNTSRSARMSLRSSMDMYRTATESITSRQPEDGSSKRGRLESTLTVASTIYHTPRSSTIMGSSPASHTRTHRMSASHSRGASDADPPQDSNRSSMATITAANLDGLASREGADASGEARVMAPTVIAFGDQPMDREDFVEHGMAVQDETSDMPPILSGDPIPFPTSDEFAGDLSLRDARLRTTSMKAKNRVSRALTLDEVEPEEMDEEDVDITRESGREQADPALRSELLADSDAPLAPNVNEGFDFILTSAKTGMNVEFVFQHLVQRVAARWRYEEWEEEEAMREYIESHPEISPQEAEALWERRKAEANGFGLHNGPMSVLERDREAIKRGIRVAAGKDPNRGWRGCCFG